MLQSLLLIAGYADPFSGDKNTTASDDYDIYRKERSFGTPTHLQGLDSQSVTDQSISQSQQGLGLSHSGLGLSNQNVSQPSQQSSVDPNCISTSQGSQTLVAEQTYNLGSSHSHSFKPIHRRNVSDSSAFNKTFANETAQFLAPFEAQSPCRRNEETHELRQESSSESFLNNKDEIGKVGERITTWNPFNDAEPFSQMSEDHIFGAEFDKIRQGSHSSSENSIKVCKEDDPFGSAPFSYPGGRRSKSSSKQGDPNIRSSNSENLIMTSSMTSLQSPPPTGEMASEGTSGFRAEETSLAANSEAEQLEEVTQLEYVKPPLEDRSKYEKLQNVHDEESDEERTAKEKVKKTHPMKYLQKKRVLKTSQNQGPTTNQTKMQNQIPISHSNNQMNHQVGSVSHNHFSDKQISSSVPISGLSYLAGGSDPFSRSLEMPKSDAIRTIFPPAGLESDAVFECNVSGDDSIGSASDLKDRIDEECDYYYCDRGEASETVSSSVYHAECESVTTHEEEGRHDADAAKHELGEGGGVGGQPQRGPKPSRAVLRARAKALKEQESRKASEDRLLGHEYGEKPLLMDDELDSGDDEKALVENVSNERMSSESGLTFVSSKSSGSRPYRKMSADETVRPDAQDDVFSLAPFKKKNFRSLNKNAFLSRSQPCSNSVSPLNLTGIVTPPAGFNSPPSGSVVSPDGTESPLVAPEVPRMPVQTDIIYEESPSEDFPIYENVTLNEGKPLSSEIFRSDETTQGLTSLLNKNPFLNPFLNEDPSDGAPLYSGETEAPLVDMSVEGPQQDFISLSMTSSLSEVPAPSSAVVVGSEMPQQIFDSTSSLVLPSSGVTDQNVPSATSPIDIFGSTPFHSVKKPVADAKEQLPDLLASTESHHSRGGGGGGGFKAMNLFSSPSAPPEGKCFPLPTSSTPNRLFRSPQPLIDRPPLPAGGTPTSRPMEHTNQDLFGCVPFKPVVSSRQRALAASKSQTLPANMSSMFQSQMAQMAKEDEAQQTASKEVFKVPKLDKKCTPPGFRKPRLTHQVLSESESSSEDDSLMSSTRKSKLRDRSKDRLKYKNIGDEFEEENIMVLPTKQFNMTKKEKEKLSKKSKKLDKLEKEKQEKQEKLDKLDKSEKKPDKNEKKQDRLEKHKEKTEKRQEAAGISNMSFEDFTLENSRKNRFENRTESRGENLVLQSPDEEEVSDLRTTGGTRFGSLKRGINPFSKLGR